MGKLDTQNSHLGGGSFLRFIPVLNEDCILLQVLGPQLRLLDLALLLDTQMVLVARNTFSQLQLGKLISFPGENIQSYHHACLVTPQLHHSNAFCMALLLISALVKNAAFQLLTVGLLKVNIILMYFQLLRFLICFETIDVRFVAMSIL